MSIPGTPESSPLDIADHVNRNWEACDQDALISLLTPCFHPSSGDSDPVNDADGAFHVAHQQQYPWLAYSPSARGAYCRFCSLGFAVGWQGHRLPWHAQLVGTPLDAAKKSTAYYANHEKTTYHNHARAQAEQFWVTVSPLPLMISVPAAEPKNWKAAEREYKRLTGQGGVGGEGPLSAEDERPVRQTVRGIYCDQCEQVYVEPCPLHLQTMPDTTAPPYAVASLPEKLYLIRAEENAVFAKETIPSLTVFGPLVGSISETRPDEFDFVCRNVQDKGLRYFQLDSDETANWMKFVRFADSPAEQNVAVYEVEETDESTACRLLETRVMFVTTEDISADEELKLGYSSNYADMIRNASWKCRAHLENGRSLWIIKPGVMHGRA
ncbi:uncharacterized protein LOC129585538 [Paramacrobiotus metropolitanus]|uniref:uncharacterized protein LOC129585538 n=1 Tax=Paramacrobiotus metropolitanus TaxID=2943436 RepID=UPI002445AB84|nr:uncharacterized protein LOC129585538 [Paramacrobiotus metropolitanus]